MLTYVRAQAFARFAASYTAFVWKRPRHPSRFEHSVQLYGLNLESPSYQRHSDPRERDRNLHANFKAVILPTPDCVSLRKSFVVVLSLVKTYSRTSDQHCLSLSTTLEFDVDEYTKYPIAANAAAQSDVHVVFFEK